MTIALLFPIAASVATILNGLAVALVLRPRTKGDLTSWAVDSSQL